MKEWFKKYLGWLDLLIWVITIFILEWLGIGDFAYEFGKELMKWIKRIRYAYG
jgi:hypothetical protein